MRDADSDAYAHSDSDTRSNTHADTYSGADTHSNANTDTYSNANADADAYSGAHANTDACSNAYSDSRASGLPAVGPGLQRHHRLLQRPDLRPQLGLRGPCPDSDSDAGAYADPAAQLYAHDLRSHGHAGLRQQRGDQ